MGSPDWVTKRDPINTQERGNVSSIPKSRTGLVQSLLSLHTHSSPAHPRRSQGTLTGRPTSPGRPGSPDSPGSPCTGKKRMEIFTFLQGDEFSAGTAKPLHECCSKLLLQACEGVLYLLSYCTRISYSPRRTLWTVCSWWPRWTSGSWWAWWTLRERGGQISDGFLRATSVRKKETRKPLTICPTSPVSPFSPGGPGRPCGGGEEEF